MMPEKPHEDENGNLIARFDILDTPNGRIAYTLAKYGYKLGISSRGGGDTFVGQDGQEHVDEDTYDFHGFDLVLLPAVKAARLKLTESLHDGKTFKQAINESLQKANPDEKRVMQETLQNLNLLEKDNFINANRIEYKGLYIAPINVTCGDKQVDIYNIEKENGEWIIPEDGKFFMSIEKAKSYIDNHEGIKNETMAANNAGANVIKQLQESLLAKQKLESNITELQEKLSVCYAKEAKLEEDLSKYKSAVQNLSAQASNAKALQSKLSSLEEELKTKDGIIESSKSKLLESKQNIVAKEKSLNESLFLKDNELRKARAEINRLNESLKNAKANSDERFEKLNEELQNCKKNLSIKTSEYSNKLANSNKLVEQYRTTAQKAVNKYIESQAVRLGIKASEISEKLPRNYSFADIDAICEELGNYKLNVSKLPFDVEKTTRAKITESKQANSILPKQMIDDTVDDSLYTLAGLK